MKLYTLPIQKDRLNTLFLKRILIVFSFFIFLFAITIALFFLTRGTSASISELKYIEYSTLGAQAGSVIPASCDSATPFVSPTSQGDIAGSHFNGDCITTCPGGVGTYDPYFDPNASTCPVKYVYSAIPTTYLYFGATNIPNAVTVTLSSDVYTVPYNQSATFTWNTAGADTCTAAGDWVGSKATGTNITTSVSYLNTSAATVNKSYTLTCTNGKRTTSKTVPLAFTPKPVPSISISSSPVTVAPGANSTITWSTTGADSCTASGDWSGSKATSGTQSVTFGSVDVKYYTLTCSNSGGSSAGSASVNFYAPNCEVGTDSNYSIAPCSGVCANGYPNYPICDTTTGGNN